MNSHLTALRDASIRVILDNQSSTGAYIASPNFRVYNYSWIRDGAFIADAMLDLGEIESSSLFHDWVSKLVLAREFKIRSLIARSKLGEDISPDEHLHCRFTINGEDSTEDWTNFQLDGFGTWIWSLGRFQESGKPLNSDHLLAVEYLVPYLAEFWRQESFDWWEESFGHQHVSTLGSICAGLMACSTWPLLSSGNRRLAGETGALIFNHISKNIGADSRLTKWIGSDGLDASVASLISPFPIFQADSLIAQQTILAIENELGLFGTYRHVDDVYFGGGKWLILSAFLALAMLETGEIEKPRAVLEWISAQADSEFNLPEQISSPLLHPDSRQEWIDNWGEPAQPLLWSHAMYLKLYCAINLKKGA
jgi:GH15 family glucan-1,4-alpha-glucosidase